MRERSAVIASDSTKDTDTRWLCLGAEYLGAEFDATERLTDQEVRVRVLNIKDHVDLN